GFSYGNWIAGLNAGRSFVTTGPMIRVKFDGQPPGTVFEKAVPHDVRVTGIADSLRPLTRIEIIVNGEVARIIEPLHRREPGGDGPYRTLFEESIRVEHSSWIAVRCFESREPTSRFYFAHTAPAHFEIDGPARPRVREVNYFIERMTKEIARNRGVLADAEVAEYERALAIYREIAKRARQ